jgi:PhnB protein
MNNPRRKAKFLLKRRSEVFLSHTAMKRKVRYHFHKWREQTGEELMSKTIAPLQAPSLLACLTVSDASKAIEFYKAAFEAQEEMRHNAPGTSKLMYARLSINGNSIALADDFPEFNGGKRTTPDAFGGSPVTLHLQVENADAFFMKAIEAGATATMEVSDMFWGARYGKLRDPFGHEWSVASAIESGDSEQAD